MPVLQVFPPPAHDAFFFDDLLSDEERRIRGDTRAFMVSTLIISQLPYLVQVHLDTARHQGINGELAVHTTAILRCKYALQTQGHPSSQRLRQTAPDATGHQGIHDQLAVGIAAVLPFTSVIAFVVT